MTTIQEAIHDVAEGRIEKFGIQSVWRVYRDGECVMLEVYPAEPVVVCTVFAEIVE